MICNAQRYAQSISAKTDHLKMDKFATWTAKCDGYSSQTGKT